MKEFMECYACHAKPGSPTLCKACLHNRALVNELKKKLDTLDGLNKALAETGELMWPVYAAAKAWRAGRDRSIVGTAPRGGSRSATGVALIDAVDAAIAAETRESRLS